MYRLCQLLGSRSFSPTTCPALWIWCPAPIAVRCLDSARPTGLTRADASIIQKGEFFRKLADPRKGQCPSESFSSDSVTLLLSDCGSQTSGNGEHLMGHADSAPQDLEQLKKQAKTLLKTVSAGDPKARIRFAVLGLRCRADGGHKLADGQLVIAREKGFTSWKNLRSYVEESVDTIFFAAVSEGRIRKAKLLLREYPNLASQRDKSTRLLPIQIATQNNHLELIRLLLDQAKPRALNTPKFLWFENGKGHEIWEMVSAAYSGDLERVRALVAQSPNLVNCRYDYQSPLHLAAVNGHDRVAKFLVEHGADVTCGNYLFGDSLVTTTTDRQDRHLCEVIQQALKSRFPYYAPGPHEILAAVAQNNLEVVNRILKESPEQVNVCTEDGDTPLHVAARVRNSRDCSLTKAPT